MSSSPVQWPTSAPSAVSLAAVPSPGQWLLAEIPDAVSNYCLGGDGSIKIYLEVNKYS